MQEPDYNLIADERSERYKRTLQKKLATCGDRDYPAAYARQDILDAERERNRLMGIVDISAEDFKEFKEVPCKLCNGNGYHHGFGTDGRDPDWCTACGGNGVDFVDISEGEE